MPATKTKAAKPETAVKVLIYDLETSPNIGWTWGTWDQKVIKVIRHRQIISFAWKWLGEKRVRSLSLRSFPGYQRDRHSNKALIDELYSLMNKADVVVAHNGIKFDDRRSNTDFIKNGLPPPSPHQSVDTLAFARSKFDFNSNRLDDLGEFLGLGRKVKHPGFEMWEKCLEGDAESWALMEHYNRGDVELLERIYLKLRPWMAAHPNLNVSTERHLCPFCKANRVERRGYSYARTAVKPRFKCMEPGCGKWSTGKITKADPRWKFT